MASMTASYRTVLLILEALKKGPLTAEEVRAEIRYPWQPNVYRVLLDMERAGLVRRAGHVHGRFRRIVLFARTVRMVPEDRIFRRRGELTQFPPVGGGPGK